MADLSNNASVQVNVDPSRIAYGVMTGVGFLGAGTILQNGRTVRGLTTAASLWCVARWGWPWGWGSTCCRSSPRSSCC